MTERTRSEMVRPLGAADAALPVESAATFRPDDAEAVAQLMLAAYRGTVDDEGETIVEARGAVAALFAGEFGTFDPAASTLFREGDLAVAATIVTHHRGAPLVAFSMTHPTAVRRGFARRGLGHAYGVLARAGWPEVRLVVSDDNDRAIPLYEAEGFRRA